LFFGNARRPPPVGDASIVSPTHSSRMREVGGALATQRRPDLARFLARERGDHVDAEGRAGDRLVDRRLELALEPEGVLGVRHVVISLDFDGAESRRLSAKM